MNNGRAILTGHNRCGNRRERRFPGLLRARISGPYCSRTVAIKECNNLNGRVTISSPPRGAARRRPELSLSLSLSDSVGWINGHSRTNRSLGEIQRRDLTAARAPISARRDDGIVVRTHWWSPINLANASEFRARVAPSVLRPGYRVIIINA